MKQKKQREALPNRHLVQARLRHHWSQRDVAAKLGTSFVNISRWEKGVTTPGPYFRHQLCDLFGQQPHELGLPGDLRVEDPSPSPPTPFLPPHGSSPALVQHPPIWHVPYTPNSLLIGREEVLDQMVNELCTHQRKTWAITGLPGVGKTSLAVALAHHPRVLSHFRDGALWIGLGPTPQLVEAMHSWGTALGLSSPEAKEVMHLETLAHQLHRCLRDRQMLLILDDAWNVSDAVAFQLGGKLCVHLLTTRSPFLASTFAQEHVTTLQPLSETASAQLLHRLAPLASQRYPNELHALIQPSGGLPLALTLLGRSVHVHSLYGSSRRLLQTLQQLRHDIQTRFQVAEPVPIDDVRPSSPVGSEISLRTTIDASVRRLSPLAKRALQALAVFAPTPQSFSEEVALAICDVSATTFDTLVDSGLVEWCQQDRYQVHQTILDYARLQEGDPEVEERLIAFIVPFVERHREESQRLQQDLVLITTALERATALRRFPLLLRGIFALQPFLEQQRLYPLAQTLVQWGQQAALALENHEALARIWLLRGKMADLCGELLQAQQAYFEGLVLARDLHHQELLSELLILVGATMINTEVSEQAESYLLEGLRAIEQLEDDVPLSRVFQYLGELADNHSRHGEALSFYQRGLASARQTQNRHTAGALLQNLGSQAVQRGDFRQAAACYEEGLHIARDLGDRQRESALLMNLGMLAWYERRPEEAVTLSQESLKRAREIGHQMRISSVLQNLGMMMRLLNQDELAAAYVQESLEIAQAIGHRWLICETLGEVGWLTLKRGQLAEAKQHFAEMLRQAKEFQAPLLQGCALFGLAQVTEHEGHRDEAFRSAQESLAIFVRLNNQLLIQEVETWRTALSRD